MEHRLACPRSAFSSHDLDPSEVSLSAFAQWLRLYVLNARVPLAAWARHSVPRLSCSCRAPCETEPTEFVSRPSLVLGAIYSCPSLLLLVGPPDAAKE